LIGELEERLSLLCRGDAIVLEAMRKRLIAKLSTIERRAAARRRAITAKKFVAQRGKCALCGVPLGEAKVVPRAREMVPPEAPLLCRRCVKEGKLADEGGG
jgi:hypothetical protein